MTSNFALQKARRIFGAQKAGHTGSLDPLATGVLPICFGEATKFSRYLLDANKGYYTTASLGDIRTTGDSDGEVVEINEVPELEESSLLELLERFKGNIKQVPSMYSALKHNGRPLYEYARKGITIERPARPVTIFRLDLDEQRKTELDMSVECSKGTYIRSLVEDIGNALGCGAHVSMLRRFKAGHFVLDSSVKMSELDAMAEKSTLGNGLEALLDAKLLPTDSLLPNNPKVCLKNELVSSILNGQAVRIADFENTGFVSIYLPVPTLCEKLAVEETLFNQYFESTVEQNGQQYVFAGVAELDEEGELRPSRLVNFTEVAGLIE
jgi:tRNA pseudouridine55 synthase